MDKNAIKKFAVWARRELIERVSQKAMQYGIEKDNIIDAAADSINGKVLTDTQMNQRRALISQINAKGYEEVMEEVAYTWFNRLIALRFMEVNGYLPTRVRVFTDEENNFKPQIIDEALHLDLNGLNMEKVYEFKNANLTEELYKYLLITQCNALNSVLPGMFQRISDYTELLLPDNLLRGGSVIEQMISTIPEEDWQDAVEVVGWLYQYYITELNEQVYDGTLSRSRIQKELLPAATTIYTPDWAVRYMVDNSLGRLWLEGHPDNELKSNWKYYVEEAQQEPEVQEQLAKIRKEYAAMKPEELKCIDPCCGSGHILTYLFDVLVQIYESYGYTTREAVESIVKNNLYGLDIDDRAAQLAYFAVMMKARQYDRRFFSRQIQPNVYAIQESNGVDRYALDYFCNGDSKLKVAMDIIIKEMHDAKEYGSILNITPVDFPALYARFDEVRDDINISREVVLNNLFPLVKVAEALAQKYDVVVTNPPYLGSSRFSPMLDNYIKTNYADVKSDLSTVMYKHAIAAFSKANGFISFITTSSWMFLSSFEKLRVFIATNATIQNLVDFGTELFDGKVGHNPIVAWITRNAKLNYNMTAIRLVEYCYSRRDEKEPEFFNQRNHHVAHQSNFAKIPGYPMAYWVGETFIESFRYPRLKSVARARSGAKTGKNDLFIREWWEPSFSRIKLNCQNYNDCLESDAKWFPYNKGGEARNWYGNRDLVVDFEHGGTNIREYSKKFGTSIDLNATDVYFKQGITWTALTSSRNTFRFSPAGCAFDTNKGPMVFSDDITKIHFLLGFFVSKVAQLYLKVFNPSLSLQNGDMDNLPIINKRDSEVTELVRLNIDASKIDWDSFETSWDFAKHPLIRPVSTVADAFAQWEAECNERFAQLKANEEELNRIFIDIYGLQDELTPEVEDKDVTVRKADLQRDIKSLISYAVGCMFGRYSPLKDGLLYAGGDWDYTAIQQELMDAIGKNEFSSGDMVWDANFIDKDNIIPICDDEYFEDDIVGRFITFISDVYGKDTLDENLKFIADALGGKGQPKEVIRNYFLNDFYSDHCKIYQKRPIYWLFDSGKKNGFKALIYMHRYQPDTIARIRTDYVHEQQSRYRTAIADMENRIANASTSERVKLGKILTHLTDQDTELRSYEEKIHHLADQMIAIDLDDGVKVNYAKFQDVLAKIK